MAVGLSGFSEKQLTEFYRFVGGDFLWELLACLWRLNCCLRAGDPGRLLVYFSQRLKA
jgi:hypothetical protein